jgi:outer membrane protein TolC
MAEAGFQSFIDARNTLYFQLASAYYPLYELGRWKGIERENIEILQSYKTLAIRRLENGVGTMVDVLRVDIMLKDAETNLEILNAKEKPLMAKFNNLLNRDVNEPVSVSDSLVIEPLPDNPAGDALFGSNPLLKELDFKIKAGKASEQAAYHQGLPRFGVGLDYIIVDKRSDMTLDDNGKDAVMGMVTVNIPLFRAKYSASVKEAQWMQKSYSLQRQEAANSLTSSYEMAWFEIRQQRQLLALYEQQVQTIRHARALLFSVYSNSGEEFEELLGTQQKLLDYEKMKTTAEVQYQIGLAKLDVLTGRTDSNEK